MTPARLVNRLGSIEARLASLRPTEPGGCPIPWLRWTTIEELLQLEEIYGAPALDGRPLTEPEELKALAIMATALGREAAGEPGR